MTLFIKFELRRFYADIDILIFLYQQYNNLKQLSDTIDNINTKTNKKIFKNVLNHKGNSQ